MDINGVLGNATFALVDYVVIGISFGVILVCGFYHATFTNNSAEDFLVGGRTMTSTPIAFSMAMLFVSAVAIMEGPAEIYYFGIQSFMASILTVVIVPISAFLFVPMFYNMKLTSIHQYIGHRFDSTMLRRLTSSVYIVHQSLLICIMLLVVGSSLEKHLHLPILTSVICTSIFTIIATTLGGFKATVWIQVFQFCWVTGFLLVLATFAMSKAGGFMSAFELAAQHERLDLFNFTVDPFSRHNFLNFVVGYGFMAFMEMVTCQSIVQRYSSLPTRGDAIKAIFKSIPLHIVPSALCLMIGVFLLSTYAGCDPWKFQFIKQPQEIVPYFIKKNMFFIPGMMGFFLATITGSGISFFSTSINSMVACMYQDIFSKSECCTSSEQRGQTTCCRFTNFLLAGVCAVLSCLIVQFAYMEKIEMLLDVNNLLIVMSVLYGPLAAVFLMAMFLPCVNKYGAAVGFICGVTCMGFVAATILLDGSKTSVYTNPLSPIMGNCPDNLEFNATFLRFMPWHPKDPITLGVSAETLSMPILPIEDIRSISHLLLTISGAVVTLVIGFIVSVLTCGLCVCASRKVPASLLHPMLSFSDCCIDTGEESQLRHAFSSRYVDRIASVHNFYPSTTKLDSNPPSYMYSSIPTSPSSVMS